MMKKTILQLLCLFFFTVSMAQSNKDIANVYIKRAWEKFNNQETKKESLIDFNKAISYLDTIEDLDVAKLGAYIHFEVGDFNESKKYAEQYFLINGENKTEEYVEFVELFVNINEELEAIEAARIAEEKRLEEERLRKEEEIRRIEYLTKTWNDKSNALSLKLDSIYSFNRNKVAVYSKDGNFGILNDKGVIIVKADSYKDFISYDGYIILKDKVKEPTKVYCFNSKNKKGFLLPNISDFNRLSTNYGKIMLPRGNGMLVAYPNNSSKPLVYDLKSKEFKNLTNDLEFLKELKKSDILDKFNKDGEVKINKEWYSLGSFLGGGVFTLSFDKNLKVHSYLCTVDGKVLSANDYQFIGPYYKDKFQAIKDGEISWIDLYGVEVDAPKNEFLNYEGISKVVKLSDGVYQIMQNGIIILGEEKLEKLPDYLEKFND
ncbi:hypothetical protein [Polaribacter sargassicola]|uniref:hypothetical protein n=1 Tax=Polaribacter sargassicola TaxID=2836891 RepID=UPI001F180341|nr:hypothetical protein [Polaribacter sp. DS7-9]MCG1037529.1 hypothetical protein [Polaribacter sp. DS7-9]